MSIFSSNLARNTLALMAAGTAILIAIVLLSLWLVARTSESADQVARDRSVRISASTILSLLLDAETGQRGYLLTGDARYLAPFTKAKSELPAELAALRRTAAASTSTDPNISRLEEVSSEKLAELNRTIDLYGSGRQDEALAIVKSNKGQALMDEARQILQTIVREAESSLGSSLDSMQAAARQLAWITVVGGACILAFSGIAFYIVKTNTESLIAARNEVIALNESLEERVAERTTALSRANDEIQRFAYIVSHDLRAPLVNIMGFTSELEVGTTALKTYFGAEEPTPEQAEAARRAAEEEIPEAVHFIRASTHKMDGLIGAILKLSREGRRELKRERVSLDDLFNQATSSLQHQIESTDTRIEIPDALPSVVADRMALEQVFGNLLDNAIKYLSPDRPGLIQITGRESGGRVKIAITDNGRGIDEKDQERIFELFRRAGAQDRPGEGVGLAHVRTLVRRMGGDVTVRSKLGEGTTFEIDLPKKLKPHEMRSEAL